MVGLKAKAGIRRAALVACLLLLGACSSTTFVYNRLDTILPWYLDDYVELNSSQDKQLDRLLQPFLAWHRQQELPRYMSILDQIDTDLDQALTPDQIGLIYTEVEVAWLQLQDQSLEWLLALGATLSDEQVEEFLAYLQERQEEYEEEYLSRSEREYRKESYEAFEDSMQDYLGRLSSGQRQRLHAASLDLQRSDQVWLQERAAWLQRLAVLMQREPGWEERVREAIALRDETVSPAYTATYEHNLGVVFSAIADVLNSRSDKQDRYLRAELENLREDLQTLVAQGVVAGA